MSKYDWFTPSTEKSESFSLLKPSFLIIPNTLVVHVEQSVRCVCLCFRTITFELNDLSCRYLAICLTLTLSRSFLKVKVTGQNLRSHEEKIFFFGYECILRGDIHVLNH